MPKVTVTDQKGLVQSAGAGVTFESDVTFNGAVSGLPTTDANVTEFDDTISTNETYDCAGNTRMFTYGTAPGAGWNVVALTNVSLTNNTGTTVKVLFPPPTADRTVTLSGMTVNGASATVVPSTVKAKKDKGTGIVMDVIRNSAGNYFVYGSARTSE